MGRPSSQFFLITFVCLALIGCAGPQVKLGHKFQAAPAPSADRALLYVYRAFSTDNDHSGTPMLKVDGQEIVALPHDGYSWLTVPAGKHRLEVVDGSGVRASTDAELEGGKTYYADYATYGADAHVDSMYGPLVTALLLKDAKPRKLVMESAQVAVPYIRNNRYVVPRVQALK